MDYAPQVDALTAALKAIGTVTIDGCKSDHQDNAYGDLLYPNTVAETIVRILADGNGLLVMPRGLSSRVITPLEPEPDPELAAMAAIVAAMDRLDEETVLLGDDVHERVIRWAMARWSVRA